MATTTTWSITYPTSANQITPLETHFANLAGSTDTALTAVRNQSGRYTGTNTQRLALTAATGRSEGTEFYTTDTDKNWMYDGTQWVSSDPGMFVIVPAAAPSGYTIASDGSLVATALSTGSRNFDNIFSGRFRNYRIEINLSGKASTSSTSRVYGRIGSSTVTSGSHFWTVFGVDSANNNPIVLSGGAANFYNMADESGTINYSVIDVGAPFISTEPTTMMVHAMYRGGMGGDRIKTSSLEDTSSLTGLAIDFGQTVQSVRIRFYGLV